jgi:hypothetical protein
MKTIEYLKADFINKAAIEANPVSLHEHDEERKVKDEVKMDLMTEYTLVLAALAVVVYGSPSGDGQ